MARRRKREEHDNRDRWLISYADFVTLLFAFFVVMYAISSVNEEKYKTFSSSLNTAFTTQPSAPPAGVMVNQQEQMLGTLVDRRTALLGEQQRKIQERMKNLTSGLSQVMAPLINQRAVSINQTKRGVVVDISASTLFGTGEAVLQQGAREVLREVAVVLSKEELSIEVEGHSDDVPIATAQFPSNWELSSARASSVARLLIDNGVPAKHLAVVGLAENQPVAPNDSAENRAKNRRVAILIMSPDAERGANIED
ncbi:MAG: flagellar motor protein MotD [Gallionellales bacterium RIFCSPLOWO2_12_FULL_59_22]|nr:MAG: flagellar motor protein MotD [Gallionellales bacterium RIFCSPLOWO2_02_FULL_59_110]OGT03952.1 MAG: flagellar motor protein MotD [Gallionellales bacterium RIFCSPLOWO2_02_58_13]OGT10604.1 MAG: flagellar motor protein MotD [Gallionellales bacterium RIFCSPLOWO2_12_FULL_59_22]